MVILYGLFKVCEVAKIRRTSSVFGSYKLSGNEKIEDKFSLLLKLSSNNYRKQQALYDKKK